MKEKEREKALESLKRLRRKGTITDDVAELASYREEKYLTDGRLTEPSDGKRFEWRKMIDEVKN